MYFVAHPFLKLFCQNNKYRLFMKNQNSFSIFTGYMYYEK